MMMMMMMNNNNNMTPSVFTVKNQKKFNKVWK